MTPRTRCLVLAACLCITFGAGADVSAQAPPAAKGTAVISGRIVAADTGLPLRRAQVRVHGIGPNIPPGPDAMRVAITDSDGAFALTGLAAGRYRLEASKARYVDTAYGARSSGLERPIEIAEGQKVENINVSLPPAGVIVGHVVDELGEPVAGAEVVPLHAYDSVKGTQLMPTGMSDRTDDIGAYRLHGLAPGTYYVSAQGNDDAVRYRTTTAGTTTGFAPTFFPGTAVVADAQPIDVVAGGEAVADIALVPTRLSAVSGMVVNAAGLLATGGFISAQPTGAMRFGGPYISAEIKPDGSFAMSGLAPGEYALQARPMFEPREPFPSGAERPTNRRSVSTPIVVTGEAISGLRLVLPDPIRIPVTATFEGATGRPPEVSVGVYSERTGIGESTMRGADGRLTLEVSPGTWRFSAHASAPWMVKRFTYRGEDLEGSEEVEITDERGGRLEVVFTTKTATVTGSVRDANGKPVADYVLWMATPKGDPSAAASYETFIKIPPDQAGRFKAERLRPGTYLFFATEESKPGEPGLGFTEFRERARKTGTLLHLRENETATVELTLMSRP